MDRPHDVQPSAAQPPSQACGQRCPACRQFTLTPTVPLEIYGIRAYLRMRCQCDHVADLVRDLTGFERFCQS